MSCVVWKIVITLVENVGSYFFIFGPILIFGNVNVVSVKSRGVLVLYESVVKTDLSVADNAEVVIGIRIKSLYYEVSVFVIVALNINKERLQLLGNVYLNVIAMLYRYVERLNACKV